MFNKASVDVKECTDGIESNATTFYAMLQN